MQATLSHYRIVKKIGAGGMGVVYQAHDERLDRDVALKVLPPGTLANEAARKRFRKEALALSKLNHPNIATVFDFGTEAGTDFLVIEYIPGLSLDSVLATGPLPEKEIIRLGMQLAEGVEAAHEQGVIHCDLKPANLHITPDARLKILDFGLAKILHVRVSANAITESLSETKVASGTPPYMAPEQLLGEKLDVRTDIWAAGCVLYEMATGRRPFLGAGPALTDAILHQPPVPPSKVNPQISWNLEAIIQKCLEKEPELRYHSTREIAVDLHRLTAASSMVRSPAPTRRLRANVLIVATLLAVLGLAMIAVLWLQRGRRKAPESAQVTPSIAVLPFVDMSAEKNQEYFSDGLAEELLDSLAKIPGLRVAARMSSFQFKGKNAKLPDIGRELNVATVLEGSVRKEGRRVRISAQMIKVSDGFPVWSETYDRELNDIFAVQEDIARSVAGSLKLRLMGDIAPSRSTNPEAYSAYLQGRYFRERRSKQDLERSVHYYEEAIRLDPAYTLAWAGLAGARTFQATISYLPFNEGCRKAREAGQRALSLDANLAEVHSTMAVIKADCDWDWVGAAASYQRAETLEPGNVTAFGVAAELRATMGRFEEALALRRQVVERDPLNPAAHIVFGVDAYYAGRPEEAIAAFKKALELNPDNPAVHSSLGKVYLAQSRPQEALAEMERETAPGWRLQGLALAHHALGQNKKSHAALAELIAKFQRDMAFQIAEVCAFQGQTDQALEWLERAYAQRDAGLVSIKGDPLLKKLEGTPRYGDILKKMHLPT